MDPPLAPTGASFPGYDLSISKKKQKGSLDAFFAVVAYWRRSPDLCLPVTYNLSCDIADMHKNE